MKKRALQIETLPLPGFQIAPMIDVVFVIMLFFMVMAGLQRQEASWACASQTAASFLRT